MKLYSDKSNARRAARKELGAEIAFEIIEQDGKFGWVVPASVQAPAADFEPVAPEKEAGGDAAEARASKSRRKPLPDAQKNIEAALVRLRAQAKASKAAEQAPKAETLPEPAAELPTSFVPEADEIASREYGMLSTRERAGEAAKAAGVSDPVISQTARGMWVWRTPALNQVWRESQKAPRNPAPAVDGAPQAARRSGKLSAKHEQALALIKRPQGATAAEIAEVTGWQEHSARARVAADLIGTHKLPITKAKEGERGKVYRMVAEQVAA